MTLSEGLYPIEADARAEAFLRDTEELGLIEHLARLGPQAHIIAPAPILSRVSAAQPTSGPSFTAYYDAPPPFSQEIYVYDLTPGSPSKAIEAMRPESTVKVINRDVVSELAAITYRPHRLPPLRLPRRGQQIRYCILHTPRAGGTVLAHLLTAASLGRPVAHMQPPLGACLRDGFLVNELMGLVHATLRSPVFATVIDVEFIDQFLRGRLYEFVHWVRDQKVKCVVMRRDVVRQAVSLHFAANAGLWETWRPIPQDYGSTVTWDHQEILARIYAIQKLEALLDYVVGMIPQDQVMVVDHTELARPNALARRASAFLGFDRGPSPPDALNNNIELPVHIGQDNAFMRQALSEILELQPSL